MVRHFQSAAFAAGLSIVCLTSSPAAAHETWLLTPAEIEGLSRAPVPAIFRSHLWLGLAASVGFALTLVGFRLEPVIAKVEDKVIAPIWHVYGDVGLLALRLGIASMMLLASFGGLPPHGVQMWTVPTFLVPDMQLTTIINADVLIAVQLICALLLVAGLATRPCGVALVVLSFVGLATFGPSFWSYTPHFAAPGLILIALGAGRISCDHVLDIDFGVRLVAPYRQLAWRLSTILIGAGFVYLGLAYKLVQPTLLIAILEHGEMPTFGLPMPVVALVMTVIEILCGALLIAGRLVRPVALAILGAITFLAVVLGETPLFHANLYGALCVLLLAGPKLSVVKKARRTHLIGAV